MSQPESPLPFADDLSSGDTNRIKPCQEVNNNDVDRISKELDKMGCVINLVQKPSNICVETCVHAESDGDEHPEVHDDDYSDEFEEEKSEAEMEKSEAEVKKVADDEETQEREEGKMLKLSKSQSSTSTNRAPPSTTSSVRTSIYGSIPVPKTNRINMSFSNDRLREIERQNHILLGKIVSARNVRRSSIPAQGGAAAPIKPVPSAALRRKQAQKTIDRDNMILLKKLQKTKSSSLSIRR